MRRLTSAEIKKSKRASVSFAVLLFQIGFFFLLLPQAYTPVPYDFLQETTVTVSSVRTVFDIHGLSLQLVTDGGEHYTLSGSYDRQEVKRAIAAGDEVMIRYYQDLFSRVFRAKYAAEVTRDGETVVSFGGKWFVRFPWLRLVAALFILGGAAEIVYGRWMIRHREKLDRMRDRRIEKKYGSVSKGGPKKMGKKRRKRK